MAFAAPPVCAQQGARQDISPYCIFGDTNDVRGILKSTSSLKMTLPYWGFTITANFNLCVKTDIFYKNCARTILWLEYQKKIFFFCGAPQLFPCDFWKHAFSTWCQISGAYLFLFHSFLVPQRHLGQCQAFADSDFSSWQHGHWLSTGRLLSFIHFFFPERCCWMQVSLFSLEVGAVVSTEKENSGGKGRSGGAVAWRDGGKGLLGWVERSYEWQDMPARHVVVDCPMLPLSFCCLYSFITPLSFSVRAHQELLPELSPSFKISQIWH